MKKVFLILLFAMIILLAQSQPYWNRFGGDNITGTDYLGGDGTSNVPLRFRTITNYPIEFYTYDARFTTPPTRIVLTTSGQLGIGMAFTPSWKLDVDTGDINLNQTDAATSEAYRIGGNRVLWHNNNASNLFVGVGAGLSNNSALGIDNTFVGNNAGNANTTGKQKLRSSSYLSCLTQSLKS